MTEPKTLGALDRSIISWIEQIYHQSKTFPSFETFKSAWKISFDTREKLQAFLDKPLVKQALHNRGMNPNSHSSKELTEAQAAAILTVANLSDRRSLQTKLKSLNITLTQWNAWKKQASFRNFLYSQLTDDFESSLDRALSGLLKAVDTGNPRAVELYLEMTGRQPTEAERNYRLAVSRIVESISRHVKDPHVIKALQEDFDKIERGLDPVTNIPVATHSTYYDEDPALNTTRALPSTTSEMRI
jgi:hypothetical protein